MAEPVGVQQWAAGAYSLLLAMSESEQIPEKRRESIRKILDYAPSDVALMGSLHVLAVVLSERQKKA